MRSIGELLYAARKKRKLNIENIRKAIKMHPKYIKALEENDYSVFDGYVHAKGFLKIYAEFLGLNVSEVLAFWRRDYGAYFGNDNLDKKKVDRLKPLEVPKLIFTKSLMLTLFVGLLLLLFFGYLFYQYKTFDAAPKLVVSHPEDNAIQTTDKLDITGKADIGSTVFINNQEVPVGPQGSFAVSIKLKEGINTLNIISTNKFDKKTEIVRTVIFRPLPKEEPPKEEEPVESTPSLTE